MHTVLQKAQNNKRAGRVREDMGVWDGLRGFGMVWEGLGVAKL